MANRVSVFFVPYMMMAVMLNTVVMKEIIFQKPLKYSRRFLTINEIS